jgi:hypothetical protein
MTAARRRSKPREVVLRFDLAIVRRLVDHTRSSPEWLPTYGGTHAEPGLWLVADHGVYLMSNGRPAMDAKGNPIPVNDTRGIRRLIAMAEGCDPEVDAFEDWWAIHNALQGGNDFLEFISIEDLDRILPSCKAHLIVVADREGWCLASDGPRARS